VTTAGQSERPPRRAYIVDDDGPFRDSLAVLLQSAGWETEQFASAEAFNARFRELEPGLVLLDLNLGDGTGLDLLERRAGEFDLFAIVMMTGAGEIATAVRSIQAGAIDFIEKPFDATELFERLDRIHAELVARLPAKAAEHDARRRVALLSKRERDVLERLLAGASNKAIARDLEISPRTVEMHRARLLDKLDATTTAQALDIGRLARIDPVDPAGQGQHAAQD
jgi:two-component system response regulator FixJ